MRLKRGTRSGPGSGLKFVPCPQPATSDGFFNQWSIQSTRLKPADRSDLAIGQAQGASADRWTLPFLGFFHYPNPPKA